jgi:putative ABC transport system ATP-binding protein
MLSISKAGGTDVVVECIELKKSYILGEVRVDALRGIDMKITRGEMVSIMGPSGCGKTTLLNIIGSLDSPTSGKVILEGRDISSANEYELTDIRRKSVGFVFQFYNLLPVLTALENVELPMLIAGVNKKERNSRALELMEKVDLISRKDHKPDELSGGERQRVAIARSLANRPSVLLADEPTGDLDTESGASIMNLLKEVNKTENQTLLLVTHDPTIARQSNRIFHIKDGLLSSIEEIN